MGSMYSQIRSSQTLGSTKTETMSNFDETDPYYFVVKSEKGDILAEGELPGVKLKLPEEYLNKRIKFFERDRVTMIANVRF